MRHKWRWLALLAITEVVLVTVTVAVAVPTTDQPDARSSRLRSDVVTTRRYGNRLYARSYSRLA